MDSKQNKSEIFISLFSLSNTLLMTLLLLIVYKIYDYSNIVYYSVAFDLLKILYVNISIFLITLFCSVFLKKRIPLFHYFLDVVIKINYPIIAALGRFIAIPINEIKASFVRVNNSIIENEIRKFSKKNTYLLISEKILLTFCEEEDYGFDSDENDLFEKITNQCDNEILRNILEFAKDKNIEFFPLSKFDFHSIEKHKTTKIHDKLFIVLADLEEIVKLIKTVPDSNRIYSIDYFSGEFDQINYNLERLDKLVG